MRLVFDVSKSSCWHYAIDMWRHSPIFKCIYCMDYIHWPFCYKTSRQSIANTCTWRWNHILVIRIRLSLFYIQIGSQYKPLQKLWSPTFEVDKVVTPYNYFHNGVYVIKVVAEFIKDQRTLLLEILRLLLQRGIWNYYFAVFQVREFHPWTFIKPNQACSALSNLATILIPVKNNILKRTTYITSQDTRRNFRHNLLFHKTDTACHSKF